MLSTRDKSQLVSHHIIISPCYIFLITSTPPSVSASKINALRLDARSLYANSDLKCKCCIYIFIDISLDSKWHEAHESARIKTTTALHITKTISTIISHISENSSDCHLFADHLLFCQARSMSLAEEHALFSRGMRCARKQEMDRSCLTKYSLVSAYRVVFYGSFLLCKKKRKKDT